MTLTPDPSTTDSLMATPTQTVAVTNNPDSSTTATADQGSVDSNAPSTDNVPKIVQIGSANRTNSIFSNPFDNYIDVTYGISFAMVSKDAQNRIANSPVNASPQAGPDAAGVSTSDYRVFASTAESKYNRDGSQEYYNIKGLTFTSFCGHLPQNTMISSIFDARMTLFEPHGFSWREDIDLMRKDLGYEDQVEPLNYLYRMEIWFSGWDPQTGKWEQNIPFPLTDSITMRSIVYYVSITTAEAAVTTQGTEYSISIQTSAHRTLRPDSLIYRMEGQQVIPQQGQSAQGQGGGKDAISFGPGTSAPTFRDFIQILIKRISDQVKEDTTSGSFQGLNIIYNVVGPDWLMNAPFDAQGKIQIAHGSVNYSADSGAYTYASQDVDLLTFLYNVMDHLPLVRQLLNRQDDVEFLQPACLWNVRSNLHLSGSPNDSINGYDGYTFDYYIEPVLSYRSRTTTPDDRNKRVATNNQQQRVGNMLAYGMIIRQYDFFFTNDNTEVLDLEFKFKYFYQEPFPSGVGTVRGEYQQGDDADMQGEQANRQQALAQAKQPPNIQFGIPATSQNLSAVLGQAVDPQSASSADDTPAKKHHGMHRQMYPQQSTAAERGTAQADMSLYQYSKQQYFRYDMIDVNMTVRFDPTWLLNPYMAGGDFTPRLPTTSGEILFSHIDRAVFIRAFAPVQSDYMNPYRVGPNKRDQLSGFYQVLTINNDFSGGRFVQKLNMAKYPHLNGYAMLAATDAVSTQNQSSISVGTTQQLPSQPQQTSLSPDPTTTGGLGL